MSEPALIPRWWTALVLAVLGGFTLFSVAVGAVADGPMARSVVPMALAGGGVFVAAWAALGPRRRRRPLQPGPDGAVVVTSPVLVVAGLLLAWMAVLVVCGLWIQIALTDFHEIESPGFTLLAVGGAVGTLPDLFRLVRGRLHRWRLRLAPEGLTYRGYRTSRFVPWGQVRSVGIQRRGPAGVRVETRDGDLVIPAAAFRLPADQLVEEIRSRARARQR